MRAEPDLELRLLGRFVAIREGREIPASDFGGRKVRALVRMLATCRGQYLSHDVLAEMLWAGRPPADPAANIQVLINRARRAMFNPALLLTRQGGYAMTPGDEIVVDAEVFLDAVERSRALTGMQALDLLSEALRAWGGEPLAEDAYADWAVEFRGHLMRTRQTALEHAASLAIAEGDAVLAVELASVAAAAEPLREVAALTLVRALAAAGDRPAALARYANYRAALADELGLDPSPNADAVQQELLRGPELGAPKHQVTIAASDFDALPFVGRGSEVDVIVAHADGGTLLLRGPSGVGKSRLIDEVSRRTQTIVARAFLSECDEPWSLARTLLREVVASDTAHAGHLPPPLFAALAGLLPELGPADEQVEARPESQRAMVSEAAVRVLGAASGVLIVVDDAQWADPTSLSVLAAAVGRLPALSLLIAYRTDEIRPEIMRLLTVTRPRAQIALEPLTADEIAELTSDADLAESLVAFTDRTPLAVSEVVRGLAADSLVARSTDGRWRSTSADTGARGRSIAVAGQRRAIDNRITLETAFRQELLGMLAVIAREVPARTLAGALATPERVLLDDLQSLSRVGLVRLGEQGWSTSHDMVADVVRARLDAASSGRLYGLLASAVEADGADTAEVARLWSGAGDNGRAGGAYVRAATLASEACADREAELLANSGLALQPPTAIEAALVECRALARSRTGNIAGSRSDLQRALRLHPAGTDRARILGQLARLASGADDLHRASNLAELSLVESGSDPLARALALEIASVIDMNVAQPDRSAQRSAEALEIYQRHGDANGAARILDARAMATFLRGEITLGIEQLHAAADLFDDSGDLVRVMTPRSTAGHGLVFAAFAERGLSDASRALELARSLGHPEGQAYALWHRTEALSALDRHEEASSDAAQALAVATSIGHRGWTATAWRAIGIAHQGRGELELALEAFTQSEELSEHFELFASWAAARRATVLTRLGRFAEAAPLVDRALSTGPPLAHYEARLAQVELAAARDDPDVAELAAHALALADAGGAGQNRALLVAHL